MCGSRSPNSLNSFIYLPFNNSQYKRTTSSLSLSFNQQLLTNILDKLGEASIFISLYNELKVPYLSQGERSNCNTLIKCVEQNFEVNLIKDKSKIALSLTRGF